MPTQVERLQTDEDYQGLPPAQKEFFLRRAMQKDREGASAPPASEASGPPTETEGKPSSTPAPAPKGPTSMESKHASGNALPSPWESLKGAFQGTQRLPFSKRPAPESIGGLTEEEWTKMGYPASGEPGKKTQPVETPKEIGPESLLRLALEGTIGKTTTSMLGEMVLPMAVGAVIGPGLKAAEWTPRLIAAVSSGGGEVLNQLFGITKPSATGVGTAMVLPYGIEGTYKIAKVVTQSLLKHLPGAAFTLVENAAQRAKDLIEKLKPTNAQKAALAGQVRGQAAVPIAWTNLETAAQDILASEQRLSRGAQSSESVRLTQGVLDKIGAATTAGQKGIPFADIHAELKRYGARIGELRRAQGIGTKGSTPAYENFRRMYAAVLADIDAAWASAPRNLRTLFKDFRETFRKDFGVQRLDEIFGIPNIAQRPVDGAITIASRRIMQQFESGPDADFLKASFNPVELGEIRKFIQELLHLPMLPSPRGAPAGSMRVLIRSAGVGGIGTYASGNPIIGAGLGGLAAIIPPTFSWMLGTSPGRRFLRLALKEGQLSPSTLIAAATMLKGAMPNDFMVAPSTMLKEVMPGETMAPSTLTVDPAGLKAPAAGSPPAIGPGGPPPGSGLPPGWSIK